MPRITSENISEFIEKGENETIEFKLKVPSDPKIIKKIIAAFSNTKGGSIIFGYDERNGILCGVDEGQVEKLSDMRSKLNASYNYSIYTIVYNDRLIAVMDVEKAKNDVYVNNVAYIRKGDCIFPKVGTIRSQFLRKFITEIQYRNRNPQEKDMEALKLLNAESTNPERRIPVGTRLYRSRILSDKHKAGKEPGFFGYGKDDSFVPPANVTRDMRANYRYIPYLYCANHPYTALVEVRPRLGADVSIATIVTKEELRLLDFTLKDIPKGMTDPKQNLFADLSMLFSKPVTSEDDVLDYIPTQFVAEYAKRLGYDGIVFRSSLTPELDEQEENEHKNTDRYNIVVFNYGKCEPIASNIVNVTRNYLQCAQTDEDINRLDIHSNN